MPLALAAIPLPDPFTGPIIDAFKMVYQGAVAWLNRQGSLLVFTDPAATYNNPAVRQLWTIVLIISDSGGGILIVLNGYHIILAGFGSRYAEALEALPTLLFAAIGANVSLLFARFFIDLNNLVCAILLAQMGGQALGAFQTVALVALLTTIALPLLALLALLIIALGIQMSVRLAIIIFLSVVALAFINILANHHTKRFGQAGLTAYPVAVFTQMLQLSVLILGEKTLLPFLAASIGPTTALAPVAQLLAGLALFWVTLRIPGMLRQWALAPVAESSQALRAVLIGTIARL